MPSSLRRVVIVGGRAADRTRCAPAGVRPRDLCCEARQDDDLGALVLVHTQARKPSLLGSLPAQRRRSGFGLRCAALSDLQIRTQGRWISQRSIALEAPLNGAPATAAHQLGPGIRRAPMLGVRAPIAFDAPRPGFNTVVLRRRTTLLLGLHACPAPDQRQVHRKAPNQEQSRCLRQAQQLLNEASYGTGADYRYSRSREALDWSGPACSRPISGSQQNSSLWSSYAQNARSKQIVYSSINNAPLRICPGAIGRRPIALPQAPNWQLIPPGT